MKEIFLEVDMSHSPQRKIAYVICLGNISSTITTRAWSLLLTSLSKVDKEPTDQTKFNFEWNRFSTEVKKTKLKGREIKSYLTKSTVLLCLKLSLQPRDKKVRQWFQTMLTWANIAMKWRKDGKVRQLKVNSFNVIKKLFDLPRVSKSAKCIFFDIFGTCNMKRRK